MLCIIVLRTTQLVCMTILCQFCQVYIGQLLSCFFIGQTSQTTLIYTPFGILSNIYVSHLIVTQNIMPFSLTIDQKYIENTAEMMYTDNNDKAWLGHTHNKNSWKRLFCTISEIFRSVLRSSGPGNYLDNHTGRKCSNSPPQISHTQLWLVQTLMSLCVRPSLCVCASCALDKAEPSQTFHEEGSTN